MEQLAVDACLIQGGPKNQLQVGAHNSMYSGCNPSYPFIRPCIGVITPFIVVRTHVKPIFIFFLPFLGGQQMSRAPFISGKRLKGATWIVQVQSFSPFRWLPFNFLPFLRTQILQVQTTLPGRRVLGDP